MNNKFMSRKFFLVVGTQLLLFICLWSGTLPTEVFQSLTMVIVSGYMIANSTQTVMTKDKKDETTL